MRAHVEHDHQDARLSPRELEALALAARGRTNGEIAANMGITVHAVKFHLASIYRKLGVGSRTEAAVRYLEIERDQLEGDLAARMSRSTGAC